MKYLILSLGLLVVGCTPSQSQVDSRIKHRCIDGVGYVIMVDGYRGFMAPHFKSDGTLYLCDKKPARFEHN